MMNTELNRECLLLLSSDLHSIKNNLALTKLIFTLLVVIIIFFRRTGIGQFDFDVTVLRNWNLIFDINFDRCLLAIFDGDFIGNGELRFLARHDAATRFSTLILDLLVLDDDVVVGAEVDGEVVGGGAAAERCLGDELLAAEDEGGAGEEGEFREVDGLHASEDGLGELGACDVGDGGLDGDDGEGDADGLAVVRDGVGVVVDVEGHRGGAFLDLRGFDGWGNV